MTNDDPGCLAKATFSSIRGVLLVLVLASLSIRLRAVGNEVANEAMYQAVQSKYDVPVVLKEPSFPVRISTGTIDGKEARRESVQDYGKLFAEEFSLYPVEFVRRTGLQRIVLCEELSFSGQLRTALPDFENHTLYLDVARGATNKTYMRTVLHHEFFHLVDYADDGEVYRDANWATLNPETFTYGTGGKNAQSNRDTSRLTDQYPGFLNHYSTTGVEEDKAEIFANLIVRAPYIQRVVKTDPILTRKVSRMKELLQNFSADLDESFWKKASKVSR